MHSGTLKNLCYKLPIDCGCVRIFIYFSFSSFSAFEQNLQKWTISLNFT